VLYENPTKDRMNDREQSSGTTSLPSVERAAVRDAIVSALAAVRACEVDEIEPPADGDIRMDSKEAEVVISRVEASFGGDELVKAADLRPDQLATVETLTSLLHERLTSKE
jgi:hypothetical protein